MGTRRHGDADVAHARSQARWAEPVRGPRTSARPRRRSSGDRVASFVQRWGWRAYALPVLAVVTIVALATSAGSAGSAGGSGGHDGGSPLAGPSGAGAAGGGGASSSTVAPPVAGSHLSLKTDDSGQKSGGVLKAAELPAGGSYTMQGTGTFRTLPGSSKIIGASGPLFRFSVQTERGISGVDLGGFQQTVMSVLSDQRSWSGHGIRLQRVDSGSADFRIDLTTPLTVRAICGYTVHVETSCYTTDSDGVARVVFNLARWVRGASAYVGDLSAYRTYMVNHEVGHALGHDHAHQCLADGLAPAMMQQTYGLRSTATNKFCQANPWPYPPGATDAPGAEQPDTPQNSEYGRGD